MHPIQSMQSSSVSHMRAEALSKCERPQTAGSREDRARYSSSSSWSAFTDPSSDKEHFHLPHCHRRLFSTASESRRSKICSSSGDDSSLDLNSTGSLKSSPKSSTKSSVKSNSSDDVFRPHHLKSKSKRTGIPETLFLHPGIRFSSQKEVERTRSCSSASKLSLTSSQGLSATCKRLEQKIKAKLKFSEFLDEVTYSVLDPVSLKAFGVLKQKAPVLHTTSLPCCKALEALGSMRKSSEPRNPVELVGKAYLETDIDSVRSEDTAEAEKEHGAPQERRGSWSNQETRAQADRMRSPSPAFERSKRIPKNKSASLTRCVTMASHCEMHKISSLQEQKEDLRKRLSYTTHKLELLESECDATRQYLETELRRAQEELEKLTEKLHRIQNSYSTLQRINQDLEEQIHRTSQRDDDDKRALSHEIIVLNNHLMEAKITIDKLREDNDLYRKDCNVAAQLLQCSKSHFRSHKLSELPSEFQERVSTHMEKHGCGISLPLYNSPYSDSVPISVIAKLLEKPAPNSMPGSHTSSPQSREGNFAHNNMGSAEKLNRRSAYKSDLYCSDTALYCPDERMRERRQSVDLHVRDPERFRPQNSTDSTTEEDGFQSSFSHEPFNEFTPSLPASSSYSSFSAQSDEKGHGASSTLSSPHQALYMDWRDENYDRKSSSSYEKDSPGFPKSRSFQHMAQGHQNDSSPVYTRTVPTCFTEPFHSPSAASPHPLYADSRSPVHIPEEDLSGRWRQLSVEDVNAYSYRNPGRVSPYSFSEQHFAIRPAKSKLGHLYSSFQEGEDVYQSRIMDPACFMPTSPNLERETGLRSQEKMQMYRQKEDDQKSERSLFHGSSKDKGSTNSVKKEYVDVSPNSSAESLNQSSLEALDLQHYAMEHEPPSALRQKPPHYQRFGTTGLCRKDSLTKAQLYGTLLN